MAPDPVGPGIGPGHHDRRVPADVGTDAAFEILVAGEPRLLAGGDRVDVGRRDGGGEVDLERPRPFEQLHQQESSPGPAVDAHHRVERVDPLGGLARIDVRHLVGHPVEQHPPSSHPPSRDESSPRRGHRRVTHGAVPDPENGSDSGALVVYTDGSCLGNPGPWRMGMGRPEWSVRQWAEPATTNQRMEITAALEALRAVATSVPRLHRGGERLELRRQLLP